MNIRYNSQKHLNMHNSIDIKHIWIEYQSTLKGFLHSKVANAHDVEDLLQDILIKTQKNLHTLKSNSSVKSWLFQIANNTIVDFYRKKSKSNQLTAEDLWYEEDDIDVKQDLSKCIIPFISSLSLENAELLTSIDINGMSQKDYADNKGISYSTLKSQVQKSRRDLRKMFEDCCHLTLDSRGNVIEYDSKSSSCKQC